MIFGVRIILNIKSNENRNKTPSVEGHFYKIGPYLENIINGLKKSDTWEIQLTIRISFISSKYDNNEEHVMYSKSDNIEIMISYVT